MKAISLFSGVGGFDLGLERAGIETVLQAEIDPWCQKVLRRHWPNTPKLSDVRCVTYPSGLPFAEIVAGGVPCQDWSVAGKREGITGARSGLFFEFARIVREMREASDGRYPSVVLFENVPGLYSASSGRDFGIVLNELAECGAVDIAWRTIDAQHWVPQRRRRVFVVALFPPFASGDPGVGRAAEILSFLSSCGGHTSEGRAAGEGTTGSPEGGVGVAENQRGELRLMDVSPALSAGGGKPGSGYGAVMAPLAIEDPTGKMSGGSEVGLGVSETMYTLGADPRHVHGVMVAKAVRTMSGGIDREDSHTLILQDRRDDLDNDTYIPAIVGALSDGAHHGGGLNGQDAYTGRVIASHGVRRLTPLECERLMGWEDDWTRWDDQGNEIPDSHRYRQCGNGVASPVAEWIGHRLMEVQR